MKILWITNIMMPAVSEALGEKVSVFGGWLKGSSLFLKRTPGIELAIATAYSGKDLWHKSIDGIDYYLLPFHKKRTTYDKEMEKYWVTVNNYFLPDVVHIHGSEYPYGLSYVNVCGNKNVVVSIQGMTSVYAHHYFAGLKIGEILNNITFGDIMIGHTIFGGHREFVKRGKIEIELLKKVKHVIGRTTWDSMHTRAINNALSYYHCNETLREGFYYGRWSYDKCDKHSIFVPQASYPIKGLHKIIEALALVRNRFPDTTLRVAGANIIKHKTLKNKLSLSGYGKVILNLIRQKGVEDIVSFTGLLNEDQMKQEYLRANVFVCPSSIENSPNSLGEAQLLGTPCVSSFVGGCPDMVEHGVSGYLYRYDDAVMLAGFICDVFDQNEGIVSMSNNEVIVASKRHNGETNNECLLSIYKIIASAKHE